MKQTNRTILFEELNPDKMNLLNFIFNNQIQSMTDHELQEIKRCLEVQSFEDALEKFKPVIYLAINSDMCEMICTKRQKECANETYTEMVSVYFNNEYPLLNFFTGMLSQCIKNVHIESTPDNILQKMFVLPSDVKFLKERNHIFRLILNNEENIANYQLKKLIGEYDLSLFLIPLFLERIQKLLLIDDKKEEKIIVIEEKEEQQVSVFQCSDYFYMQEQELSKQQKLVVKDFLERNLRQTELKNRFLFRNLILPYEVKDIESQELLIRHYTEYLVFYEFIINEFWIQASDLLETLLGIHSFFQQYQVQKPVMPPKLLIANLRADMFFDTRNQSKLKCFLRSTNHKMYDIDTIWYAIVPKLEWNSENNKYVRKRFQGNVGREGRKSNSIKVVKLLVNILSEFKIQTFVSPNIMEKATNRYVTSHGIQEWIEVQKMFADRAHASYIYPCMPNFTLVPAEHTEYILGKTIGITEWGECVFKKQCTKVWLKTIGIEASYVAAGLLAACQCPGYLKDKFGRNVDVEIPGVGYRIMEKDNSQYTYSDIKMDVYRYEKDVKDELERRQAGILFMPYKKGTRFLCAQSAAYLYGQKESISDIQIITYIERVIQSETQDFKEELIKLFLEKKPGSTWDKWNRKSDDVNTILKKGEKLEFVLDEKKNKCKFEISLSEIRKIELVKLNK